jgi:hypothetical protein
MMPLPEAGNEGETAPSGQWLRSVVMYGWNRRGWGNPWVWIILGFFMLNMVTRLGAFVPLLAVGLILLGIWWLANQTNALNAPRAEQDTDRRDAWGREMPDRRSEPASARSAATSPRAVADKAVIRAGNALDSWMLDLDDIGIVAYHGDDTPDICRVDPVAPDTTHLRPFIVIDLPYERGRGTIRFELFDEVGDKRFEASSVYQLTRGRNFITTKTWLPLEADRGEGRWQLRVSIGDKPLALHDFPVRAAYAGTMRTVLREDGEIDPWLVERLAEEEHVSGPLSLDDLLAGQADTDTAATANRLR